MGGGGGGRWIWLINSALAALHGTVHSRTPYSCQSRDCHLVVKDCLQIFYYTGSFWEWAKSAKQKLVK